QAKQEQQGNRKDQPNERCRPHRSPRTAFAVCVSPDERWRTGTRDGLSANKQPIARPTMPFASKLAGPVRRTLAGLVRCTLGSKTATRHHAIACANRATVRADDTSDSDILCRRREVGARLRHERGWRAMAY